MGGILGECDSAAGRNDRYGTGTASELLNTQTPTSRNRTPVKYFTSMLTFVCTSFVYARGAGMLFELRVPDAPTAFKFRSSITLYFMA
jgi:hypothetical protein